MLFNSYHFILVFLPITFFVYFILNRKRLILPSKVWLIFASLFFYGWWNPIYIPLIIGSILLNYSSSRILLKKKVSPALSRSILFIAIGGNLALLAYFKYMDFFINTVNILGGSNLSLLRITLPLGISFYTFTQIAYLVDTWKGTAKEQHLLNYFLFVTFFPYLLSGPIIHHKEIIPSFDRLRNKAINYRHIAQGLSLFFIGLFKKVIIADTIAIWANSGFDHAATLTLVEAWVTSLSYTLQLYFDFSGYTDMALGSALLFNIRLPINFNSPYKSLSVQEFWRRWNITLSRFMRDHVYIPLGGNQVPEFRIHANILITFLLVGLWHGAGWMFVFWGLLHGFALIFARLWKKIGFTLPKLLSWFLTFNFVNIAWVFFRARSLTDASKVLKGMLGMNGVVFPESLAPSLPILKAYGIQFGRVLSNMGGEGRLVYLFFVFFFVSILFKNSNELVSRLSPDRKTSFLLALVTLYALLNLQKASEFIYFTF
jgi:alginate O-acetyltransferase complex protein AlgI